MTDNPTTTAASKPPGFRFFAGLAAFYAACWTAATYPAAWSLRTRLPSIIDPLVHVWTLRWYRTCLSEGRSPFLCPDLQYPVGAPLGYQPPMQLQALIYLILAPVLDNDILIFNILWVSGFLLTGLGTALLAWHVVRDRWSAAMAGLLAMLSGPMMFWSHSQLEQVTFGAVPLFLVAWLRWLETRGAARLILAAGAYVLVAMSAPYHGVFVVVPAVAAVAWLAMAEGWRGAWPWLRARIGGFVGFGAITAPILAALFVSQIWATTHGFAMGRSDNEYAMFNASFWSFLVPMPPQLMTKVLPNFFPAAAGFSAVSSYLGVVTLGLLYYAHARRVSFRRAAFWWALLALMVVLSQGAYWTVGSTRIPLPGLFLKRYVPIFRPIRVPARFNLFAAVFAAIIAAAALKQILGRLPSRAWRGLVWSALAVVAVADLASVPYMMEEPPALPGCYGWLLKRDPRAAFLEAPQNHYGFALPAATTYWQSIHKGRTSAGYTASLNTRLEYLSVVNSPFNAALLANPEYLKDGAGISLDTLRQVDFDDYAWLYLTWYDYPYVITHHRTGSFPEAPVRLDRIEARMSRAKIYDDPENAVFDRALLPAPEHPTLLCADGWGTRTKWQGREVRTPGPVALLAVYNPTPGRDLKVQIRASTLRKPRGARLLWGDLELARWDVAPGNPQALESPSFLLPAGLTELTIEAHGSDIPSKRTAPVEGDRTPISLLVDSVGIVEGDGTGKLRRPVRTTRLPVDASKR